MRNSLIIAKYEYKTTLFHLHDESFFILLKTLIRNFTIFRYKDAIELYKSYLS